MPLTDEPSNESSNEPLTYEEACELFKITLENPSTKVITKAYHKLALIEHPDKATEENRDTAKVKFQLIVNAYEGLIQGTLKRGQPSLQDQELYQQFVTALFENEIDKVEALLQKIDTLPKKRQIAFFNNPNFVGEECHILLIAIRNSPTMVSQLFKRIETFEQDVRFSILMHIDEDDDQNALLISIRESPELTSQILSQIDTLSEEQQVQILSKSSYALILAAAKQPETAVAILARIKHLKQKPK